MAAEPQLGSFLSSGADLRAVGDIPCDAAATWAFPQGTEGSHKAPDLPY